MTADPFPDRSQIRLSQPGRETSREQLGNVWERLGNADECTIAITAGASRANDMRSNDDHN